MMRLIDADALEELFREVIGGIAKKPEMNGNLEHMVRASAMVTEMIQDAPTIEPEPEIIRCRDCKHWKDSDGIYRRGIGAESKCPINIRAVYKGDFYCALAERNEGEADDHDRNTIRITKSI